MHRPIIRIHGHRLTTAEQARRITEAAEMLHAPSSAVLDVVAYCNGEIDRIHLEHRNLPIDWFRCHAPETAA